MKNKYEIILSVKGDNRPIATTFQLKLTEIKLCKLMRGLSFYQYNLCNNTFDWCTDSKNKQLLVSVQKECYQVLHAYICGFMTGGNIK